MPYKSEAQRRLLHHLAKMGKVPERVVHEFDEASRGRRLPEYSGHRKHLSFGGQVQAVRGTRCPACDYPLDQVPVALDAGEGCPRCGYGDAKDVPHYAQGGEVMEPTAYRASGGEVHQCPSCGRAYGGEAAEPMMKELYPRKTERGADLDDGFIIALRRRRG